MSRNWLSIRRRGGKQKPNRYLEAIEQNHRREVHALILYRSLGTWAYDDPSVGIREEFFVAGADLMLDEIRAIYIEDDDPYGPFRLSFSAHPLPDAIEANFLRLGYAMENAPGRRKGKPSGAWYEIHSPYASKPMEGWLCSRLLDYFPTPPETIWVRADPLAADAVVPLPSMGTTAPANWLDDFLSGGTVGVDPFTDDPRRVD